MQRLNMFSPFSTVNFQSYAENILHIIYVALSSEGLVMFST